MIYEFTLESFPIIVMLNEVKHLHIKILRCAQNDNFVLRMTISALRMTGSVNIYFVTYIYFQISKHLVSQV